MYEFSYCCVNSNDMEELRYIIDNMYEIKADTFLKNISLKKINDSLGYGSIYKSKKALKDDYAISYYRLEDKKRNMDVYVLVHSRIEYVFKRI